MLERFAQNPNKLITLLLFFLIVSVITIYAPSLSVPFYLDDRDSIVSNLLIQSESLDRLLNSPTGIRMRIVGYFTLWANYQHGGLDPFGYHVVNIAIHLCNALLVYALSLLIIRHFALSAHIETTVQQKVWALLIAAIWALHPLNTQAVTYVVQRLASIVSLFYLLSIICYIKLRQQEQAAKVMAYFVLLLGLLFIGIQTKQNFVTVVIFLFCWEMLTATLKVRRFVMVSTVTAVFALLIASPFLPELWQMLDAFTRDADASSRSEYFYSQTLVLWDYVARFVYPLSLQMNIDAQLKSSFEPVVALAMVAHITVITAAIKFRKHLPLLAIGVAMFYTSHSVESFIIPIKDLAFEHRTYIGNIGLTLAVIAVLRYWFYSYDNRNKGQNGGLLVTGICLLLGLSTISFMRNSLWQTPLDFYANEVKLAPEHPRANASYGTELMKQQRYDEAEPFLKKSVDIHLANHRMTASGLTAYMTVLYHQKKYQLAAPVGMLGLKYIWKADDRSVLLANLAFGYIQMGFCDFAKGLLTQAIKLDATNTNAKTNLQHCLNQLSTAK